jgi:hypothetical protein
MGLPPAFILQFLPNSESNSKRKPLISVLFSTTHSGKTPNSLTSILAISTPSLSVKPPVIPQEPYESVYVTNVFSNRILASDAKLTSSVLSTST